MKKEEDGVEDEDPTMRFEETLGIFSIVEEAEEEGKQLGQGFIERTKKISPEGRLTPLGINKGERGVVGFGSGRAGMETLKVLSVIWFDFTTD
ncbi:hypothetical protein M0802_007898 [Mischocyttarus mexicanus]|nr:hypothetical protein M0802_007898 [Mischocyttarus mexicanus]